MNSDAVFAAANSYFGLLRQSNSTHGDRAQLARAVLRREHAVNRTFTKAYRKARTNA